MAKILLIEDEEPIRRVMVRILQDENATYEVTEAHDGSKGLSALKKNDYRLGAVRHQNAKKRRYRGIARDSQSKHSRSVYYAYRSRKR